MKLLLTTEESSSILCLVTKMNLYNSRGGTIMTNKTNLNNAAIKYGQDVDSQINRF